MARGSVTIECRVAAWVLPLAQLCELYTACRLPGWRRVSLHRFYEFIRDHGVYMRMRPRGPWQRM